MHLSPCSTTLEADPTQSTEQLKGAGQDQKRRRDRLAQRKVVMSSSSSSSSLSPESPSSLPPPQRWCRQGSLSPQRSPLMEEPTSESLEIMTAGIKSCIQPLGGRRNYWQTAKASSGHKRAHWPKKWKAPIDRATPLSAGEAKLHLTSSSYKAIPRKELVVPVRFIWEEQRRSSITAQKAIKGCLFYSFFYLLYKGEPPKLCIFHTPHSQLN